jgi:hypothetical protein
MAFFESSRRPFVKNVLDGPKPEELLTSGAFSGLASTFLSATGVALSFLPARFSSAFLTSGLSGVNVMPWSL